jgi:hypothetical protein
MLKLLQFGCDCSPKFVGSVNSFDSTNDRGRKQSKQPSEGDIDELFHINRNSGLYGPRLETA